MYFIGLWKKSTDSICSTYGYLVYWINNKRNVSIYICSLSRSQWKSSFTFIIDKEMYIIKINVYINKISQRNRMSKVYQGW